PVRSGARGRREAHGRVHADVAPSIRSGVDWTLVRLETGVRARVELRRGRVRAAVQARVQAAIRARGRVRVPCAPVVAERRIGAPRALVVVRRDDGRAAGKGEAEKKALHTTSQRASMMFFASARPPPCASRKVLIALIFSRALICSMTRAASPLA